MAGTKDPLNKELHQKLAATLFNHVWDLMEKKRRTEGETDEMINAAHASRYHWSKVGKALSIAVGDWQISRVYALLGRSEPSLYHANRSLALCKENQLPPFYHAYAYEALARAYSIAGKKKDTATNLALAEKLSKSIKKTEDRDLLSKDLKTISTSKVAG